MITQRELRRHGNIDEILSAHCGAAISAVADVHDIPVPELRFWLISTFVAAVGGCQDAAEGGAQTGGAPTTVARALEDRHLLRARAGPMAGSRIYRLIADRIIEPLRHTPDDLRPDVDPAQHLLAAERALTAGEAELAGRYAELARRAAPETDLVLHGSARSLLGNIARDKGEPDQAEAHYRAAVSLFEAATQYATVALLLAAIGRTLIARGELDAGIRELHAAVRRRPADTTIQAELSAAVQELTWRLAQGDGPPDISPA
jgi:tetratricopeptide (TPR) repeat protein